MAASPEVSQTVPPEDLEEGELPSSEDEEGEIDESSNEKGNDDSSKANDSVNNDDESIPTVTSKRPFESPEREIEPNDDKITKPKRPKLDNELEGEDAEEGEIFSDDEEAAYYPQLVKKRSFHSPSRSPYDRGHEDHPHSDDSDKDGHNNRPPRYRGGSPNKGRWRDQDRRGRGRGKSNPSGSDLIGPPIRHDRLLERKWEEPGKGTTPTLTLEIIESRLSRSLAILPTPKGNQCLSLDEMNYPAPPQWYLKSVAAYNKRLNINKHHQQQESHHHEKKNTATPNVPTTPVAVGYHVEDVSPISGDVPNVKSETSPPAQSNAVTPPSLQPQPLIDHIPPLFSPEDALSSTDDSASQTAAATVSSDISSLQGMVVGGATAIDQTPPTTKFLKITVPFEASPTQQKATPPDDDKDEFPVPRTTKRVTRSSSRRKSGNVTRKKQTSWPLMEKKSIMSASPLIVSIDLSVITITNDTSNEDFNYDDYLDQLNDEEDSNDEQDDSYDFRKAAADFWIDTKPTSCDPLDEDFTSDASADKKRDSDEISLKSLVVDQNIDDAIVLEERKDINKVKKGLSGLKIPRKKETGTPVQNNKPPLPVAVHEREKIKKSGEDKHTFDQHQQEPDTSTKPCKYFLNGHCIHGNSCQYSHNVKREKKKEMCKFYLQDACDKGTDCLYYHGDFPCKYYHTRHMCYHGDKCKFSHAQLNDETYDILMNVIDPNMRDFVKYPVPQAPPSHIDTGILGPMPAGLPIAPPPQPPSHQMVPITQQISPSGAPQPLILQTAPPPHYNLPPGPPEGNLLPPMAGTSSRHIPGNNMAPVIGKEEAPSIAPIITTAPPMMKSNVQLSPSFDVAELFPEPHPQVLPHELATQLRKVLLPTPTSSNEAHKLDEELELEYWQNPKDVAMPTPVDLAPPAAMDEPPYHNLPAADYEEPYRPRPPMPHPPLHDLPPPRGYSGRPPPVARGPPGNVPMVRFPPSSGEPSPGIYAPHYHHHVVRGGGPGMGGVRSSPTPPPVPAHVMVDPRQQSRGNSAHATDYYQNFPGKESNAHHNGQPMQPQGNWRDAPVANETVKSEHRLVDPRQKYSHLKIKPKLQEQAPTVLTSSLKKPEEDPNKKALPSLLQDKKYLDKLMAPQELFGTSSLGGVTSEKISLFGSHQQVPPDSPIPSEKQSYGEIKMTTLGDNSEDPLGREALIRDKDAEKTKEDVPVIPSYLTHLGLDINEEDEDELQIESAFGALQARKRRISELSSSISDDTNSQQDLVISCSPPVKSDSSNNNVGNNIFSFSSSMFTNND